MRHARASAVMAAALALGTIAAPAVAQPTQATYEVTITNLTRAQWFTPPAAATHGRGFDAFSVGRPASEGIRQIAENGDLAPFTAALAGSSSVLDWTVAVASEELPPLGPGQSVTFTLDGRPGARFTFASMLICTNDGFTGTDAVALPRVVGHTATTYGAAYDAGTEVNTEAWEDLVPPCAQLTGFGDQGGTGASNPDLAEDGKVRRHRGITGTGDLVPSVHGWRGPVSSIEITRIG